MAAIKRALESGHLSFVLGEHEWKSKHEGFSNQMKSVEDSQLSIISGEEVVVDDLMP